MFHYGMKTNQTMNSRFGDDIVRDDIVRIDIVRIDIVWAF